MSTEKQDHALFEVLAIQKELTKLLCRVEATALVLGHQPKELWLLGEIPGYSYLDAFNEVETYHRSNKIEAIKAIRQYTDLGLKEAKQTIESFPCKIDVVHPIDQQSLMERLERRGYQCELR